MNMDNDPVQTLPLHIATDHPAFAGHFPGMPIVPGVVLLDEALHAIAKFLDADLSTCQLSTAKFLHPVMPGQALAVQFTAPDAASDVTVRFDLADAQRKFASGSLRLRYSTRRS